MNSRLGFPRTLIYDIEVSPCKGWFWGTGKQVVGANQILEPGKIICISYKFLKEKKVFNLSWDKNQCDKKMLEEFSKIVQTADIIVGHNGDAFDKKWVNARLAFHKLPTIKSSLTEDTLKQARKEFKLPSFKLDYLCKYFNIGRKVVNKTDLWEKTVWENCRKNLAHMVRYCHNDVKILEKLYLRIYSHVSHKLNMSAFHNDATLCPHCSAKSGIMKNGFYYTKAAKYQKFLCTSCANIFRNGINLLTLAKNYGRL